jgi:hypothetical protein
MNVMIKLGMSIDSFSVGSSSVDWDGRITPLILSVAAAVVVVTAFIG